MHRREWKQALRVSIDEAWTFFSDPNNLARITPPGMNFRVVSEVPPEIFEGLLIRYKVSPLFGIPLTWVTRIGTVQRNRLFIDEQLRGPYKRWHHEHHFEERDGGVLMHDILEYELYGPVLKDLIHPLLVGPKIEAIFSYRRKVLDELFGTERSPARGGISLPEVPRQSR